MAAAASSPQRSPDPSSFTLLLASWCALALLGCATINIFAQSEMRLNGQRLIFARIERLSPLGNGRVQSWAFDHGKFIVEAEDGVQVNGVEIFAGPQWVRIANYPVELKPGEAVQFQADMTWKVVAGAKGGR